MPYWNKYPMRDRAFDHVKPHQPATQHVVGIDDPYTSAGRQNRNSIVPDIESSVDAESITGDPTNEDSWQ